jgi:hypothetical protein
MVRSSFVLPVSENAAAARRLTTPPQGACVQEWLRLGGTTARPGAFQQHLAQNHRVVYPWLARAVQQRHALLLRNPASGIFRRPRCAIQPLSGGV